MKVTPLIPVTVIEISNINGLDPVTVVFHNRHQGAGKIIIECYGRAWTSSWGSMGRPSVEEFFGSCDNDYLLKNLVNQQLNQKQKKEEYAYLGRIVDAVKEALTKTLEPACPAQS